MKVAPKIKSTTPGLQRIVRPGGGRSKAVKRESVKMCISMAKETSETLERAKTIIGSLGPELVNKKTGEVGRPVPSSSLLIDRALRVYMHYLVKIGRGGKAAMTEEFKAVTEPDTGGAGKVLL